MRTTLVGLILIVMHGLAVADEVAISVVEPEVWVESLPLVPWVVDADREWTKAPPLFSVADASSGASAEGWVAVSDKNVFVRVVVQDDQHVNEQTGSGIWDGDCIQVGIDAMGNGAPNTPMDSNDAAMAFALTAKGSEAWAYHLGRRGASSPMTGVKSSIVRNDAAKTTTYDIALQWSHFNTQPGASPILGIAVQINDSDVGSSQTRLYFGRGAGGVPQPGLFQKLRLGDPVVPLLATHVNKAGLWREGDAGEVQLAVAGMEDVTLYVSLGDQHQQLTVPATGLDAGVRRFVIRGVPRPLPVEPVSMEVSVGDTEGTQLVHEKLTLQASAYVFDELNTRIDALAVESPHELFTRHLRTVQAVANVEWQLARLMLDQSTAIADHAADVARQILNGLDGDAADWETYRQRRRKLVMGFMAPSDRTVQYYMLSLPKDWQPEKAYPMIVFLHGGGTSHVAVDVAASPFRGSESGTAKSRFDGDFDTIYIEPYARGRHGYDGIGERDVLLAVDDAVRTLNVDTDRIYLTGFSMGGHGAWAVGAHSPDRWAAVCINAGAPRAVPTGIGIGRNYIGLPTRIWHGEADPTIQAENATRMAQELRAYGSEPELILLPDVGHEYYGQPQESANLAWLLTHTRKRPDRFGFTAETREYLGRNGVSLTRDPATSFTPWFELRIDGNQVHLTSGGTPALNVILGDGGLGLAGDVNVFYDGKQVYAGPASTLRINTADGTATQSGDQRQHRRPRG